MNVPQVPVRMEAPALTATLSIPAFVLGVGREVTATWIQMSVCNMQALILVVRMEPPATTSQALSGAYAPLASLVSCVTNRVAVALRVVVHPCVATMAPVSPLVANMATPASVMRAGNHRTKAAAQHVSM